MTLPRIRQLVFASNQAEDIETLRQVLDLGEGFVDPGVGVFGLTNGVFALGDQFLEVVVPTEDNTAAGRFIERTGGIGGYMAIFQTDDLAGVRRRADDLHIRRVWNIDRSDISASHLHPADIGAAIVSVDEAHPEGSWLWGGPGWRDNSRPGALTRLDVTARDPQVLSERWGRVLRVPSQAVGHDIYELELGEHIISFRPGDRDFLSAYHLLHPDPDGCLQRARECGLVTDDGAFVFTGVRISLATN
jgi:hypothetical protein